MPERSHSVGSESSRGPKPTLAVSDLVAPSGSLPKAKHASLEELLAPSSLDGVISLEKVAFAPPRGSTLSGAFALYEDAGVSEMPKAPRPVAIEALARKVARFTCTERTRRDLCMAAGITDPTGATPLSELLRGAPVEAFTLSEEEFGQALATSLRPAKRLSGEAGEIEQHVLETRQYIQDLTGNYIRKVTSTNQILPGTEPEDRPVICDPLLDEMRTAASTSFLVYQYKLQILLDKAIAKKIKRKRKDEKAIQREKEEAAAKLKTQATAPPEAEARGTLATAEPLKSSETLPAHSTESLVASGPSALPLLVPKLQLERTPSGNLKGNQSQRGEKRSQRPITGRPQSSRRSKGQPPDAKLARPPSAQRLPQREGEKPPLPLTEDARLPKPPVPEPTAEPKAANREAARVPEEQPNEYDEEQMGSGSELGSDEYYEEEEVQDEQSALFEEAPGHRGDGRPDRDFV